MECFFVVFCLCCFQTGLQMKQPLCCDKNTVFPRGYQAQVEVWEHQSQNSWAPSLLGLFWSSPQSHKTVHLVRVTSGMTFTAVYSQCCAIYRNKSGHLVMRWQLEACACSSVWLLVVKAAWSASVSGDTLIIINGLGPACLKHSLPVRRYLGTQVAELGCASRSWAWEERWKQQGGSRELPLGMCFPVLGNTESLSVLGTSIWKAFG